MVSKDGVVNITGLCPQGTVPIDSNFAESNFEKLKIFHQTVWKIPNWKFVLADTPYSHENGTAQCYRTWSGNLENCSVVDANLLCIKQISGM